MNNFNDKVFNIIEKETQRQKDQIELIASENFVSKAVLKAQGSVLTNKYAEGYPGRRYYGGCEFVDEVENLARDRLNELFKTKFCNVQPHSGSNANLGVYLALLNPGDTILGMGLDSGGHLTHGHKVSLSGKWFNAIHYGVDRETYLIDYDQVRALAKEHKPKIIIAGGSAYSRTIDFKMFREIADEVGAYLMVDMAHFSGLVAGGVFPSPVEYADVMTSTTHKTLRGPRSGIILTNNEDLAKKIDKAIMPGLQGGPLMHIIAAKAVAFGEALQPEYKGYVSQVVKNAQTLSKRLEEHGFDILTGGTDCHLLLVDLRSKNINGAEAEMRLEEANITCNKNSIAYDPLPPMKTSGLRLGTAAMTTRGFKEVEFSLVADLIAEQIENPNSEVKAKVAKLCKDFPLDY